MSVSREGPVSRQHPLVIGIVQSGPVQPTSHAPPRPSRSPSRTKSRSDARIDVEKVSQDGVGLSEPVHPLHSRHVRQNDSRLPRTRHPAPKQEIAIAIANKVNPENPPSPIRQVGEPRALAFSSLSLLPQGKHSINTNALLEPLFVSDRPADIIKHEKQGKIRKRRK